MVFHLPCGFQSSQRKDDNEFSCISASPRETFPLKLSLLTSLWSPMAHWTYRGIHDIPFQRNSRGWNDLHRITWWRWRRHISMTVGCTRPISSRGQYRRFSWRPLETVVIGCHITLWKGFSCRNRCSHRPPRISCRVTRRPGINPAQGWPIGPARSHRAICRQQWRGYNKAEHTASNYRFHLICLLHISENPSGSSGSIPSMNGIRRS